MSKICKKDKTFAPIDFGAMLAWLGEKGRAISIENLGGGGPHLYEVHDDIIWIDGGRGKITLEMWQEVCHDMVSRIPYDRLSMAVEYSHYEHYIQTPSIPVLCWAFCEEFLKGVKVYN